jgi:hypothetical protein
MPDDREIARRALDFQARAKDYPLITIPGYMDWSKRKLDEGVSPALIANLDARGMVLLPEEMLADLKWTIGEA